jgi:NADPH:quinone reductase-like Zn-dependent oxidoreductase
VWQQINAIQRTAEGFRTVRLFHAAGVNPYDLTALAGGFKERIPAQFPLVPGAHVAGTIEQTGTATTEFVVGDEVFGRVTKPTLGGGTFAEYVAAPSSNPIAAKPRSISFEQAAALPIPGMAALVSVKEVKLRRGDTVLVVGATGSVGGYAVQLAAHRGAHVIGTADPSSEDDEKAMGAAEVIDYRDQGVAATVKAAHPDGIDALIDAASDAASVKRLTDAVRSGGRVVTTRYAADVDALAKRSIRATNINLAAAQTVAMLEEMLEERTMKEDSIPTNAVPTGDLRVPVTAQDHIQGPDTAPVTLVEYADYECPYSHRAYHVLKGLQRELEDQLRFVYRNFPLREIHPHAQHAAEAAEAAANQGRFWEMHDSLFEHQHALDDEHLRQYAASLGLDTDRFTLDMVQHRYAGRIEGDLFGGLQSGVRGTPTFFINGVRYEGSPDKESLLSMIREAASP